ncbi:MULTISPECIES: DUF2535 family protein [unclassified Bacillus (in: firmicutes)]|uniref:DUF2535 family protein n=1 Tax=unclassified Bacillus (in: firmicutes) TaxID=185979 RepID=UPI0027E0E2A0|nr:MULTISPECIES: DUF2535 family protein [unclassified Bacillus (in: firmicutes)]
MVCQKIKVIEIPVLDQNNCYYFMIQVRLQKFISFLYNNPQEKSCFSFREYLKRKMSWSDFNDLFSLKEFKNNA